jgi:hypothetical protein
MTKLLASLALLAAVPGCFTASGAAIGHHYATEKDDSPQVAGVVIGIALDVATVALLASAARDATSDGGFTYGPGEGMPR